MAVSRALRRLLRIRNLEEGQCRVALDAALGELDRLGQALAATTERDRLGRRLVVASAASGELEDRLAGVEETHIARRQGGMLAGKIAAAEIDVARLRREFLGKRVERRQAETLIEEAAAGDAVETGRHEQQAADDWYRFRLQGADVKGKQDGPGIPGTARLENGHTAKKT
jgi:hypothetical protein